MMQETYSAGGFIAAELGYYFATTVDLDYLNQGANISVLSRYPIKELHVQEDSSFMNVGARIAISETQDLWVMSNWYGMDQFPDVFRFTKLDSPRLPRYQSFSRVTSMPSPIPMEARASLRAQCWMRASRTPFEAAFPMSSVFPEPAIEARVESISSTTKAPACRIRRQA